MTPLSVHVNTGLSSWFLAMIWACVRLTVPFIDANQVAILAVSALTGRVSLTLVYLMRPGSWWTKQFMPPSSRCSMTTSHAEAVARR